MKVTLWPAVWPELLESAEYYEYEQAGLGADLLRDVDAALDEVASHPQQFAVVLEDIRRATTRRFPFGVFFIIKDDAVIVFAIVHLSRD